MKAFNRQALDILLAKAAEKKAEIRLANDWGDGCEKLTENVRVPLLASEFEGTGSISSTSSSKTGASVSNIC